MSIETLKEADLEERDAAIGDEDVIITNVKGFRAF